MADKEFPLIGRISKTDLSLLGEISPTSVTLLGRVNVHTMETGDGREIELGLVGDTICWRRVEDVAWVSLVPLSDISPSKGVDYWTTADKSAIVAEAVSLIQEDINDYLDHSLIQNRDADDQHPMSAITGLSEALSDTVPLVSAAQENSLAITHTDGTLGCSGISVDKIALKDDIAELNNTEILALWNQYIS